ncbi:MAG: MarC family protein [Candidatus Bilamarchaeaceae archaeon]
MIESLRLMQAFILLLVIMDPVLSLAAFLALTKEKDEIKRREIAFKAVLVAAVIFLLFAFGGNILLEILNVSMDSFKAAGGIILVIMGIQLALGISFPKEKNKEKDGISEIAVVIGTPLISGPATIATAIILVNDFGLITTLIAGIAALSVVLLSLLTGTHINKLIGRGWLRVLSTMMGIVTLAWGVQFIVEGVRAFILL